MKKIILILIPALFLLGCQEKQTADLLFINAVVYTLDDAQPIAEAVAIKDGRILNTGTSSDLRSYEGPETKVIDLGGKTMTPGFIEGHGHFMGMGYSLMSLDLMNTESYEQVIELVGEAVSRAKPGDWILGRGWHQSKWTHPPGKMVKGFPTHEMLSQVSPDNPVFLRHASGHAALANRKAMEMAGVDRDTPDREGGEMIRDPDGNPTGIFNETAMGLISAIIPENDAASDRRAYRLATENCLKEGITSFHDAGVGQNTINLYREMSDNGEARIRLYVMLDGSDQSLLEHYFERGPVIDSVNHMLTIRSVKLYADGALGSRGAWLLDDYSDMSDHRGHSTTPLDIIREVTEKAAGNGFQVCTHAIGDRANREVLDIYETVIGDDPDLQDHRFRIEHAQHLSDEDIPRFAELGVIPAMQAIHLSSDRPWAIERLGQDRIEEGAYVWQKLLQTGTRIVNGTDVPVEPLSPVECFYASVTRKTLEGLPPGGYEASQKMSREQALRSYTIDPAYGAFEEDVKGSIERGKLADLTIFTKDIMNIPEEELLSAEVYMTVIDGRIVYQKDQ